MAEPLATIKVGQLRRIEWQIPVAHLCPETGAPEAGSFITISYAAAEKSLELNALRAYIAALAAERAFDVEAFVQQIQQDCQTALSVPVQVAATFMLRDGITLSVET
jgi:NADPH-dependent 7-cyano-7-deazaguanine reductase QueF